MIHFIFHWVVGVRWLVMGGLFFAAVLLAWLSLGVGAWEVPLLSVCVGRDFGVRGAWCVKKNLSVVFRERET